jgi:HAE1 family hydrophobic/amphiphilic exporter-1
MKLPEFSIRRPVTIIMFFLGVVLLGFISWQRLPQELFPSISYPQITVVTTYENASPEEVETLITKIIEEAVGTVNGLKRISSISKEGLSLVILDFDWGTNMDFASLGVREKIDLIKERLPLGSEDPIVMKFNPFEIPVMILSITGELSPKEMKEICRKQIKDELEKIEGVASANIVGGREREILVELDQGKLYSLNIPILKVASALKETNFTFPAGTIKETFYEYLIRTMGEFAKVKEVESTVVDVQEVNPPKTRFEMIERQLKGKTGEKRIIHVRDIGKVKDTLKELTNISRYNGKENISIRIQRQAGANIIKVAKEVKKKLKEIRESLPKEGNIKVEVIYDQSKFIKNSIKGVRDAAVQGGILAFFVLLFFLRNFYSSLIVTLAIPISIMVTFNLMYFRHISVNMMSLGGLALGVGMLVDNAIVVVENIFRWRQLGKLPKIAAGGGASEVSNAIIASTLTTIAVFLPLIFVKGVAGQLFKELAFTVTFSLLASLAVALSIIPQMASKSKGKIAISGRKRLGGLQKFYTKLLLIFLKSKGIGLLIVFGLFFLGLIIFKNIDRELMPKVDQREFLIKVDMPTGTKIEITNRVSKRIEKILLSYPDVKGVDVTIGSPKKKEYGGTVQTLGTHQAQIVVNLKKISKRSPYYRKSQDLIRELEKDLKKIDLEKAHIEFVLRETILKQALQGGKPVNIEVRGKDLMILESLADELVKGLKRVKGLYDIRSDFSPPQPEIKVNIMKDKASLYNLSVNSIALSSQAAIKGYVATKYKEEGKEYDIRVRLRKEDRNSLAKIRNILIHSPLGIEVPLADVAKLVKGKGPSQIERLDQERVILVSANVYKRGFSEVAKDIDSVISGISVPKEYVIKMGGERKEMEESFKDLKFALILAILLVYMIMAAQFESLWQPFVIMFTVPLSLIGVSFILFLTHTTLNVVAMLGFIILGGIVVNNGIVLIDHVNGLRKEGLLPFDAVVKGGQNRLRPIMMTAMTTILGLMPLALGFGEGSELRAPMAITVIGGLFSSTFLTLLVIPNLYLLALRIIEPKAFKTKPEEKAAEEKKELIIITPSPPEEKKEEIKETIEEVGKPSELNERQIELIEYLKRNGRVTRKEYAEKFKVSIATAARDLKELQEKGLIASRGPKGRGRWYEIREK